MTGEQIVDFSRVPTRDAGMIEYAPDVLCNHRSNAKKYST